MRAILAAREGGAPHEAWLRVGAERIAAVVGPSGIVAHKQEGDGATPSGVLPIRRVLYRADRCPVPICRLPREPIAPDDGWCDDPADGCYNRMVRLPYGASTERLWREDTQYNVVAVLGHNDSPTRPGAGSAIFLHAAPPGGGPTKGCIGLALVDLLHLLQSGLTEIQVLRPGPTVAN